MCPGEVLGNLACLVALQRADEMPLETHAGGREHLGDTFLHVVLAKGLLAGIRQRGDLARAARFRDRQQAGRWPVHARGHVLDRQQDCAKCAAGVGQGGLGHGG